MKVLTLNDIRTSGLTLIEASAGTGKTWTITALYILLVLEQRLKPEEILVVTYTKAATAELRERIRKRLTDTLELYVSGRPAADELEQVLLTSRTTEGETAQKLLTRALYSFDDAAIFTIHGFCQRALLENAFESGSLFDSEMTTDQSGIVRQVCDDFWRTRVLDEAGPFLERLTNDGYTPEKLAAPFDGHYQNPDLRIIPDSSDPDLAGLTARRDALLPVLACMWSNERDAIISLLNRSSLSQTSYKPAQIDSAASKLDTWLASGSLNNGYDGLALFTAPKIEAGMKKGSVLPEHPFFGLCQQLHQAALQANGAYAEKLIQCQTELHGWLASELARRKQALNLRSYDDLLLDLHLALEGGRGVELAAALRQRYRAALIDEFQDTDPLQWRIFARLAGLKADQPPPQPSPQLREVGSGEQSAAEESTTYPLLLIGDPKQAIYSFRGADIQAYIAAASGTAADKRWTLDTNRRSTHALVTAVNTLFAGDDPFLNRSITFNAVQSGRPQHQQLLKDGTPLEQPLRLWLLQRQDQTRAAVKSEFRAAAVAATTREIARLLDGSCEIVIKNGVRRPLRPGDMAVLVKAHYQAELIQSALNDLSIPSVQRGSATIFQSREALDILRILRAAAEPTRGALIREALLTAVIGLSANRVFELERDEDGWEIWLMRFRALHDAAAAGGIIALASRLLGECGVRGQVLSHAGGERRMTNILHCMELLHQAEREQGSGLETSVTWLERRITGEQEDETALLRLETDANAVTISTIHASKGLEYPVVFLPFSGDPPSSRDGRVLFHAEDGSLVLDLGSDRRDGENKQKARAEQEAEAARLLYVALTRAEFLCNLAWGCYTGSFGSPLRKLLHGSSFRDAKAFAAAPDQMILEDLAELSPAAGSTITARFMPLEEPVPAYRPQQEPAAGYSCRELQRAITVDWRVSSFSSITAGSERSLQPHDRDALNVPDTLPLNDRTPESVAAPADAASGLSIFDFPRGAAAGTCLHELFETLDLSRVSDSTLEPAILACLQRNGYDRRWLPAVAGMIRAVTAAPLIPGDPTFSLSRLSPAAWQTELEFYLPLEQLSGTVLRELFSDQLDPLHHGDFAGLLAKLQVQETRGMLLGFMDMVFEHNSRYYIIDWKSNHLGGRQEQYGLQQMREAMAEHAYILQYHLYSLALDRLLRLRLTGYDYDTHFGGAIYVFLRGVSTDSGDFGIYHDRPALTFIQRANRLLLQDGVAASPLLP